MPAATVTFKPEKKKKKITSPDELDMRDNQQILDDEAIIESDSEGDIGGEEEATPNIDGLRGKKRKQPEDDDSEEDLDFTSSMPSTSSTPSRPRRITIDSRMKMVNYNTSFPSNKYHTIIKYELDNCRGKTQFNCSIPNRAMPALTAACLKFCKQPDVLYYMKNDPKLAAKVKACYKDMLLQLK